MSKNKRQAQGRPMRSTRNEVNLRLSDEFGTIAKFCETLKTDNPDTASPYLYGDIFCRGIRDYLAEKKTAQQKESENGK